MPFSWIVTLGTERAGRPSGPQSWLRIRLKVSSTWALRASNRCRFRGVSMAAQARLSLVCWGAANLLPWRSRITRLAQTRLSRNFRFPLRQSPGLIRAHPHHLLFVCSTALGSPPRARRPPCLPRQEQGAVSTRGDEWVEPVCLCDLAFLISHRGPVQGAAGDPVTGVGWVPPLG